MKNLKLPRFLAIGALWASAFAGATSAQAVDIFASHGAHVRSGTHAATNFGPATAYEIKKSASPTDDFNREIYLKFDLGAVTSIRTAKLRLYGLSTAPEIVTTDLHSANITSWNEATITWNSKPATDPVMWSTVAIQDAGAWHEWDITRYLQGEKASGRNLVTLVLKNSVASTTGAITFNSDEHGSNRPHLQIVEAFPWSYYEAEGNSSTTGTVSTGTTWGDVAFEARGRKTVVLDAQNEHITWQNAVESSHAIVRYSIGDGQIGVLGLYTSTNGTTWTKKGEFQLTSVKMRETKTGVTPGNGIVRYFDEALLSYPGSVIPAGRWMQVRKESADNVAYAIDFLELEKAPGAASKPGSEWIDVTASPHNAVPNDGLDDRAAFKSAIDAANTGSKKVWIPAGTFDLMAGGSLTGSGIAVGTNVEIRGAGMWHTTIRKNYGGTNARIFHFTGNGAQLRNLKVVGSIATLTGNSQNVVVRADDNSGHLVENVWAEYTSLFLGFNVANTTVRGNRVRNTYKDSIHFARNSVNNRADFNTIRNSGDDNIALVSYEDVLMANNIVEYNVGECGWWGRGLTIIGGNGNIVRHNLVNDCAKAGVAVMLEQFGNPPKQTQFTTNWVVEKNTIVRCGNQKSNPVTGAVAIYAAQNFPFSGRMEQNLIMGMQHTAARITGFVGDPGAPVYYRYNIVEQPLGFPTYERKVTSLQSGSTLTDTPNTDL